MAFEAEDLRFWERRLDEVKKYAPGKKFGVSVVISAVDNATANIRKINQEIEKRFKPLSRLGNAFKRLSAESGLTDLVGKMQDVGEKAGKFGENLATLGKRIAFMGIAAAGALGALVYKTAMAGDAVDNLAGKTGISAQELQKLQHAANMVNVPMESFNEGILTFTKGMGQLRAGTGKLYKFLMQVNPAFAEQLKETKSNEEAFGLLQSAMHALPDEQRRMALSVAAFGGAGMEMVNMAQLSKEELAKLKNEASDLGMVMDKEAIEASGNFDKGLKRVIGTLTGVRNTIGVALLPTVNELMAQFTELVKTNRPAIEDFAKSFASAFKDAIPKILAGLQSLASFFGTYDSATQKFSVNWDRVGLALKLVAAVMVGPTIASFASLLVSLTSLSISGVKFGMVLWQWVGGFQGLLGLGSNIIGFFVNLIPMFTGLVAGIWSAVTAVWSFTAALLANPITWVVLGIAALAAGVYLLYKNWDAVTVWWTKLWDGIFEKVKVVWDKIAPYLKPLGQFFGGGTQTFGVESKVSGDAVTAINSAQPVKQEAAVRVSFDNVPRGVSVRTEKSDPSLDFGMDMTKGPLLAGGM